MMNEGASRGFWVSLIASVVVHCVAGGAIVWAQSKQPAPIRFIESIPVELVKLGKKRDPELLPRLTAPEPPPPAPDEISLGPKDPKKDPKKKPEKAAEKRELSDAARRLLDSRPSAMDRALAKVETDEGDPEGDAAGTTTDPAHVARGYQAGLISTIRGAYVLPEAIAPSQRAFLKARVLLFVLPSGEIREFKFVQEHPNELFMAALETLLQTIKLPPPPKELAQQVSEDGIELVFSP